MRENFDCRVYIRRAVIPTWPRALHLTMELTVAGTEASATVGVLLGTPKGRLPVRILGCKGVVLPQSVATGAFRELCRQAIDMARDLSKYCGAHLWPEVSADPDLAHVAQILSDRADAEA